jgi:hypothetical protein
VAGAGSVQARDDAARGARWRSSARLLAGLPVEAGAPLASLAATPVLREHQAAMSSVWQTFAQRRLAPMRQFAQAELGGLPAARGPLYYPFSGPDALHALALFPQAGRIILTGLEPVGGVPDLEAMDEATLRASLALLRRSISTVLAWSFFKTNDMKVEFSSNRLEGVTPILLVFAARHGLTVQSVESFDLPATPPASDGAGRVTVHGVRVRAVHEAEAAPRVIEYLSADISNAGLAARPAYLEWVVDARPSAVMLKSASYLLHRGSFSQERQFILDQVALVVQDDSGIPWRHFEPARWNARLYGRYTQPIALFANRVQADLKAAYSTGTPGRLPFSYGYNFQDGGNNLQRFTRIAP